MNQLTKAAINNIKAKERDSKFVTLNIYVVIAVAVVTFAIRAVEHLVK